MFLWHCSWGGEECALAGRNPRANRIDDQGPSFRLQGLKLPLSLGEQGSGCIRPCAFPLASCILCSTWPYLSSPLCCYLPCLAPLLPGYLRSGRKKGDLCFFSCWNLEMTRKWDMCSPTCIQCGSLRGDLLFFCPGHLGSSPSIPTAHPDPSPCPTFRVESALSLGQCWLSEGNQVLCPGTCDTVVVTAVPLDRALRLTLKEWCCQACPGFLGCAGRITKAPFFCALLNPSVYSFGD